jgi:ferritin-like metal-binding protein YciE
MANEAHEQLTKYLTDAHGIEEQALAQLRDAPKLAGDPKLADDFTEHLRETEGHEERIRALLEARGASPSRVKDVVMAAGGKGFLLFARLQPDTPGKLHAHALSYEALELSSYELLRGVADRLEEREVARVADEIAAQERAMMERLESTHDLAVEASLRELEPDDLREQLRKYLADAHAIEEQAIELLERAPELAGSARLARIYEDHLAETRGHAELVADRLEALGGDPSTIKDAALRLGALNWGLFFQLHPDTPGKLACFARAFEHLEVGGYEQLTRVAQRVGDTETVETVERILGEEREAQERLASSFDDAITASLDAVGISG